MRSLHEPKRAERENCETPLGVAMSIEDEAQRVVPQFPANPDESGLAGNWAAIISRWRGSIEMATPKGFRNRQRPTGV